MSHRRALLGNLTAVLAFTAIAVVWGAFILAKGGGLPDLGGDDYKVDALLPSGAAIAQGSRVTAAGVRVGSVDKVTRRGAAARVELKIDDESVLPLPADTRVQVRQRTPVGENYIAIIPGTSKDPLASGDSLPVTQADEFVDVDRLLSVLHGETRERARQTIRSLGGQLRGHGDELNVVLDRGSEFVKSADPFLKTAYPQRRATARLIKQLGTVSSAIGQRESAIRVLARDGLRAFGAIRDNDDALRATLEQLPSSLRQIRATAGVLQRISPVAAPVADDAAAAVRALRPAIKRLGPAAQDGRRVLRDLGATSPGLRRTLRQVSALSRPISKAFPSLHKTICEVSPTLRYIRPWMPQILHVVIGLGSASNAYDATGHTIRLGPIFSENSMAGLPDGVSKAMITLMHSGLAGELGQKINFDPYPQPDELGTTRATSVDPIGPEAVKERYERVEADC